MLILSLIVFSSLIFFFIWILWTEIFGAGWSPTPMESVKAMLRLANVNPNDILYDLGAGDGRIVTTAVKDFGATAIGYEIDPIRFLISWLRIIFSGSLGKAIVKYGNFYKVDLSSATVVTLFLRQHTNEKLREKLEKELAPGSRVVTYYWTVDKWRPVKADRRLEVYLYIIGISNL
ncbi:MAG: SAM-dependent methyltransferase [bacterium]